MKKPKVNSCPDGSELSAKRAPLTHYRNEATDRGAMEGRKASQFAEAEVPERMVFSVERSKSADCGVHPLIFSESTLSLDSTCPHLAQCSPQVAVTNSY